MDAKDARSALARYVRMRLKKEEQEHGRGYQAEVARRTGLSTAHVANIMNRPHQGVGMEAAQALAGMWSMSFGELAEIASEWAARAPPAPPDQAPELPPNLRAALDFVRTRRVVPEEVAARSGRVAEVAGDVSVQSWIVLLHDMLEMQGAALPQPPLLPAARKRSAPRR